MMGERRIDQGALFYEFCLERHVPQDHLLRAIDRVIDLESVRAHLKDHYSPIGRPSICPATLAQKPMVQKTKSRLRGSVTDDAGVQILREEVQESQLPFGDAEIAWEIFKRWLMVFGGGEWRTRPAGEEVLRGRQL